MNDGFFKLLSKSAKGKISAVPRKENLGPEVAANFPKSAAEIWDPTFDEEAWEATIKQFPLPTGYTFKQPSISSYWRQHIRGSTEGQVENELFHLQQFLSQGWQLYAVILQCFFFDEDDFEALEKLFETAIVCLRFFLEGAMSKTAQLRRQMVLRRHLSGRAGWEDTVRTPGDGKNLITSTHNDAVDKARKESNRGSKDFKKRGNRKPQRNESRGRSKSRDDRRSQSRNREDSKKSTSTKS